MDRLLLITVTAAMVGLLSPSACAQQQMADHYVVAGDLATPQVYQFPAGTVLTVRQILSKAGQAGVQGNAIVLRGQPLKLVASEICASGAANPSAPLLSGDIVVFRTLQTRQSASHNVVRVTDSSIDVLEFAAGQQFTASQIFGSSAASKIAVHRTGFGPSARVSLGPNDLVQHGDVLVQSNTESFPRQGEFAQVTSEPPIAATTTPASSQVTVNDSSFLTIPGIDSVETKDNGSVRSVSAPLIASEVTDSQFEPSPFDLPRNHATEDPEDIATASKEGSELELLNAQTENLQDLAGQNSFWNGLLVLGIVFALGLIAVGWVKTQQEKQLEQEAAERLNQSIGALAAGDSATNEQTAQTAAKHTDHDLSAFVDQDTSKSPFGGEDFLQLAVGFDQQDPKTATQETPTDPAQSLREPFELTSDPELAISAGAGEAPGAGVSPVQQTLSDKANVDDDCPVLSAGCESESANPSRSDVPKPGQVPIETLSSHINIDTTASSQLVGPNEWFGRDWRQPEASDSGQRHAQTTEPQQSSVSPQDGNPQTPPDDSDVFAGESEVRTASDEGFDRDDDVEDTEVEILRQRQSTPAWANSDDASTEAHPASAYPSPQPASESRQELEDLIQNKLPLNLQQADLPLAVSLFGKPSGPRRLRIDAAHTQIAPPHMMSRSRSRNRRQSVEVEQHTAGQGGPNENSTSASSPGLDKALNFIDEQLDS